MESRYIGAIRQVKEVRYFFVRDTTEQCSEHLRIFDNCTIG